MKVAPLPSPGSKLTIILKWMGLPNSNQDVSISPLSTPTRIFFSLPIWRSRSDVRTRKKGIWCLGKLRLQSSLWSIIWNEENTLILDWHIHHLIEHDTYDNKYLIRCQYVMKIHVKIILVVSYNANEYTRTASSYEC